MELTVKWGLIRAASDGCEQTVDVAALVQTYSALLFRVAYSVVRNAAEAEDVVQDTLVRMLQHRGKLGEIENMRVWLVRIAWNLALDRRRRIRPEQMDDVFADTLAAAHVPADEALVAKRERTLLLAEIDRLPRAEREALLLSAMEELGTAELAAVLGRSESATRALLFRARTRLKERIGRMEAKQRGGR